MFSGPLLSKSEAEKVSYLLIWVGEKGRDIHNTFSNITEQNRDKLETYYTNYEQYVTPKSNKVFARFKFHTRVQTPADTFDAFVTDLKLLVQECGYADPDEMVRDRIVFGVSSPKIREKLISVGSDLTLRKTVEIAHTVELSQTQLKTMAYLTNVKFRFYKTTLSYFINTTYKNYCVLHSSILNKVKVMLVKHLFLCIFK